MLKRTLSMFLSISLCFGALATFASEKKYSDVADDYTYKNAITYLTEKNIVEGKGDDTFAPEDYIKREEFAKILAKGFELSEENPQASFTDVDTNAWYAPFVDAVNASGLMTGVSQTKFGVGDYLSRQDLALILYRFAKANNVDMAQGYEVVYNDEKEIADYAVEAVKYLSNARAIRGKESNNFCPTESANRGVAMQALYMTLLEAQPKDIIDKLASTKVYEPAIMPKVEIISEDFEDDDYGELFFTEFHDHTEPIERDATQGYNSSGSAVLTKAGFPCLVFKTDKIYPGEVLELSYMVKGENIKGDGQYRALCQIFDDEKNWLWEAFESARSTDTDWVRDTTTVTVPDIGNDLDPPEFYYITLCPYMMDLTGTVHFDDFKLSKVLFDPMETVLMSPNYKGLIYGEGGKNDINLRAYISDMSGAYPFDSMNFTAQIIDNEEKILLKSESASVKATMDVTFSSESLPMGGDYYLQSILTDKESGKVIQSQFWGLRKREADYRPEWSVDEYNRIVINGKPELPMYMYNSGGGTGNYAACALMIEDAKGHNLDGILESGFGSWYLIAEGQQENASKGAKETSEGWLKNFEEANKQGIKFVAGAANPCLSFKRWEKLNNGAHHHSEVRPYIEKRVYDTKDYSELGPYYMFDEADGTKYGEDYHWANEIMSSIDLDHPTINAICDLQGGRPGVYAKTSDFLGTDPYPATGRETDDLSRVYDELVRLKQLNPNRPCFIIPQAFGWKQRGDLRAPTKTEFRNMIFQSLAAGTCMINSYCYGDLKRDYPDTWEENWKDYMEVYDEVGELENVYLSVLPAPYYEVENGGEWLNHISRRYDGKSYIFAVNNQQAANSARFYLDGVKEMKALYSGKTYTADENGWFNVDFDSLEADVFIYEQADYKSSHAELELFTLTDENGASIVMTDSEETIPAFITNAAENVYYRAKTSDFAKVYINGKETENQGMLSLKGLEKITVKIVSEDGRFENEKSFLLK